MQDVVYRHVPPERLQSRWIRAGNILVEKSGGGPQQPAGRVAYCEHDIGGTSSNFIEIVRVDEKYDSKFVFYLLHYLYKSGLVLKYQQQTTGIINFKFREYQAEFVRVPESKQEQAAIAEILTTVDQAIAQTEALIAKQRRIKAGLLHDLLTRGIDEAGRLRDPATHRFKQTAVGLAPVEWEVKTIGEMASFVGSGVTPTGGSNVYGHEGIIFIRSQNVYNDGLVLDDVAYIDAPTNQRMQRSQVFSHDVLLNITGASIGRCCFVPGEFLAANVNQHVCIIRLPDATQTDALYLSAFLASPFGQRQVKLLNAGGNREGLNYQQVKSIVVAYPVEQDERDRFAELVSAINESIRVENERREKLLRLKSGLMQDLLTGRVAV